MALFVIGGVRMTGVAVDEFRALLKAGHATQPQCYTLDVERDRARDPEGGLQKVQGFAAGALSRG